MKFHEKLYMLRKKHKLSQGKLAKKIGVSQTAIANYESGIRFPNQEVLLAIADVFQVSVDFLFNRTTNLSADITGIHHTLVDALLNNNQIGVSDFLKANITLGVSFEYLAEDIISPALHIIGDKWQKGEIDLYQEHIASGCLSNALSKLKVNSRREEEAKNILVFTARDEKHDLPAKISNMAISSWGHKSIFMSQLIPLESLVESVKTLDVSVIIVSITIDDWVGQLEKDLKSISEEKELKGLRVIIGGQAAEFVTTEHMENVEVVKDLKSLKKRLKR